METSLNSESSSALSGWLHVKTLYICLVLHKWNRLCFSLLSGMSILLCYDNTGVKHRICKCESKTQASTVYSTLGNV